MTDGPQFSVIIPVHNGGRYLAPAIDSVLKQSLQSFELVVVDDGSTDGAVDELAVTDPRLWLIRQSQQGASAACNAGLAVAKGEYVAILDQDDLWAPGKLSAHAMAFEEAADLMVSFTWTRLIGPEGEALSLPMQRWRGRLRAAQLFIDNVTNATSAVAMRRSAVEAVGGFDKSLRMIYDFDLYLRILQAFPNSAAAVPQVLTSYRRHPGQMSADWRSLEAEWLVLLQQMQARDPAVYYAGHKQARRNVLHYLAFLAFESKQLDYASNYLLRELSSQPLLFLRSWRNCTFLLGCLIGRVLPAGIMRYLLDWRDSMWARRRR